MEKTIYLTKPQSKQEVLHTAISLLKNGYKKNIRQDLAILFTKYCMLELNIDNINFVIEKNLDSSGYYLNNEFHVTQKELNSKNPTNIFNTIAHELRHCYQHNNFTPTKEFDKPASIQYPLNNFPSILAYMFFDESINNYKYYLTSNNEYDANLFAISETKKFFYQIKELSNKNKLQNFAEKNINKIERLEKEYQAKYNDAYRHVCSSNKLLKKVIPTEIDNVLNRYTKNNKQITNAINSLMQMYCDDSITNKVFDFAIKNNDNTLLINCINNTNTNISKNQFMQALNILAKTNNITFSFLKNNFNNYKEDSLNQMFKSYTKSTTNTKKYSNKTKMRLVNSNTKNNNLNSENTL